MTQQENQTPLSPTPIPIKSAIEQFREAITSRCLTPPELIEQDGFRHYFANKGEIGNRSGWYEFHAGDIAIGSFGNVRTGFKQDSWVADIGRPLTPDEKVGIQRKRFDNQADQKNRKEYLQIEAQRRAANMLRASTPAEDSHPFLIDRKIKANGIASWDDAIVSVEYNSKTQKPFLRIVEKYGQAYLVFGLDSAIKSEHEICENWKNFLIVSMRDEKVELQSLQLIARNGEKRFLYGGKMQGSYHILGDLRDSDTLLITESFASAAAIHEITGHPVVVVFEPENLPTVARALRKQRPEHKIIVCADDDFKTPGNPGLTRAAQATQMVGGMLLVPDFGKDRPDTAIDFSDMLALRGSEAMAALFAKHSLVREVRPEATLKLGAVGERSEPAEPITEVSAEERPSTPSRKRKKATSWGFMSPSGNTA